MPGGGADEKKASAVRGHISGTHEIIMVYIKCNLAKRMQRCIEARLSAIRAVPSRRRVFLLRTSLPKIIFPAPRGSVTRSTGSRHRAPIRCNNSGKQWTVGRWCEF